MASIPSKATRFSALFSATSNWNLKSYGMLNMISPKTYVTEIFSVPHPGRFFASSSASCMRRYSAGGFSSPAAPRSHPLRSRFDASRGEIRWGVINIKNDQLEMPDRERPEWTEYQSNRGLCASFNENIKHEPPAAILTLQSRSSSFLYGRLNISLCRGHSYGGGVGSEVWQLRLD